MYTAPPEVAAVSQALEEVSTGRRVEPTALSWPRQRWRLPGSPGLTPLPQLP